MSAPVRSILFVPGDSERKIEKSRASGADAIVLDLEDSVAQARKAIARETVATLLRDGARADKMAYWVRINPIDTPDALHDLAAIVAGRPAGILLPKAQSPADVAQLSLYLDALEIRDDIAPGSIPIMPVATETARAPLTLHHYPDAALPRLFGITWGAEDLSSALGASSNKDDDGRLSLSYRVARSLTLMAAKACGVEAIDTVYPDFRDLDGLKRDSLASRREGFTGRFAIHPDQVEIINAAFSPTSDEIAWSQQVVAAFAAAPDAGVVALDGKMLDMPHLKQARHILALSDAHMTA
ncbi:CoA ester lyase [Sphingobium sp.]|uniref:HpcH/HpaI aldolase/citrate lyase family protein n=1 Tax=Sphingobium sp. TaxID=1912891 RepID=UPI002615896A|nr:CoA ester lyase [Sphingobium sp.]